MAWWKRFFTDILRRIENAVDALKFRMVKVSGTGKRLPIKIATYRGFGRRDRIFLQGRVLVRKSIRNLPENSPLRNLIDSYNRFESDEVPNARLMVKLGENAYELLTDEEGYFTLDRKLDVPLKHKPKPWAKVTIKLLETPWRKVEVETTTSVLIPPDNADFGIISDIDDTILLTGVTSILKWRVFYNTFFKSAQRRIAFPDAGRFFQALQKGAEGNRFNPIFYVSNSPRNIYDLIKSILKHNGLPKGPVLLRDLGIPYKLHPLGYKGHKANSIVRILQTYPKLSFILVGDSGEKDTYIYHETALAFPGRIKAIYIRDVNSRRRRARIQRYMADLPESNIYLFRSYEELLEVAGKEGWLAEGD